MSIVICQNKMVVKIENKKMARGGGGGACLEQINPLPAILNVKYHMILKKGRVPTK